MKKVLIMGITGGFGRYVAQSLARQGWTLKVLMRNASKLPSQFKGAEIVEGDVSDINNIRKAAQGVDLMVYAINPANYQWDGKVVPWLDNAASVAEENKLTLVFPGNVYIFDPQDGPEFDEQAPLRPISTRGDLRKQMETRLQLAAQRGAQVILIRSGDFFAAETKSSWLKSLIKPTPKGIVLSTPCPTDQVHTWAYLPDVAQTVSNLVEMKHTLPNYNVYHFKGHRASFNDIANAILDATGKTVTIKPFPWWLLRTMAPFFSMFKYVLEMRYLWNTELNLSDKKLVAVIGKPIAHTPLAEALLQSGLLTKTP